MTEEPERKGIHAMANKHAWIMVIAALIVITPVVYAICVVGPLLHEAVSATGAPPPALAAGVQKQSTPAVNINGDTGQQTVSKQKKTAADKLTGPMIEQLASSPNNAMLAAQIGNIYYDAQAFALAAKYYQKSLAINSENLPVRVDLATALFSSGQIDPALAELNSVLQKDPNNNAALFNRGLVKWKGKNDVEGAVADWESILRQNPNGAQADKIRAVIAEATNQKT